MCAMDDETAPPDVKVNHKGPLYVEGERVVVVFSFHPYTAAEGELHKYGRRKSIVKLDGGRHIEVMWDKLRKLPPPPAKE